MYQTAEQKIKAIDELLSSMAFNRRSLDHVLGDNLLNLEKAFLRNEISQAEKEAREKVFTKMYIDCCYVLCETLAGKTEDEIEMMRRQF